MHKPLNLWSRLYLRFVSHVGRLAWHIFERCELALIGRRALSAYDHAIQSRDPQDYQRAIHALRDRDCALERLLGENAAMKCGVMRRQLQRIADQLAEQS